MSSQLSLEQANTIIANAFTKGAELGLAPLTVVVLDAGGHLQAMQRADKATFFRPQIAFGKAWGALALGMSSRTLFNIGEDRPMITGDTSDNDEACAIAGIESVNLVADAGK